MDGTVRSIALRLSRKVEIDALGRSWQILFTHDALLDLLELTGLDAFASEIDLTRPSSKLLRAALYVALRHAGAADFTLKAAGEMMRLGGMTKIRVALLDAWCASMPEPEPVVESDDEEGEEVKAREPLTRLKAWAIARENLRLSDREWLSMTPRMLQELTRQRLENMQWQELMVGTIVAHNANHSMRAPEKAYTAKDFMLHPFPKTARQRGVTGEEIMTVFAAPEFKRDRRSIN
jgi:hypothetical protein